MNFKSQFILKILLLIQLTLDFKYLCNKFGKIVMNLPFQEYCNSLYKCLDWLIMCNYWLWWFSLTINFYTILFYIWYWAWWNIGSRGISIHNLDLRAEILLPKIWKLKDGICSNLNDRGEVHYKTTFLIVHIGNYCFDRTVHCIGLTYL